MRNNIMVATQKLRGLKTYPVTPDRWEDMVKLFGKRGACGGCWCMWWRITRSEFEKRKGDTNKRAMRKIVKSGEIPGLLTYYKDEPVAWCSVAPREAFPVLDRSRVLKRIDDEPVWSIVCFYITRAYRRHGLMSHMIREAVKYCRSKRARIIEAYPVSPRKKDMPDVFAWSGIQSAFEKIGFREAARRSSTRPIMRYYIGKK
jgi:GNAT superfamily N-acetyltransferase